MILRARIGCAIFLLAVLRLVLAEDASGSGKGNDAETYTLPRSVEQGESEEQSPTKVIQ